MELLGYAASILMGLSLGMMGGGGAILTVPILVYLFNVDPILATAYSLALVGLTALVGGFFYMRKGQVDLATGLVFAIPSFAGVYATRSLVIPALPQVIFEVGSYTVSKQLLVMMVFAFVMILASFSMIRGNGTKLAPASSHWIRWIFVPMQGLLVGGMSGFVGAGGGFLIVPALVVLVGMPMKTAVGTSLFIIASNSLFGFIGDLQHQTPIDWGLLLIVAGIALSGLFIGLKLSTKVSETSLKRGFGNFVLIMGALILFDQIYKL